jgi:hypothetical protein
MGDHKQGGTRNSVRKENKIRDWNGRVIEYKNRQLMNVGKFLNSHGGDDNLLTIND